MDPNLAPYAQSFPYRVYDCDTNDNFEVGEKLLNSLDTHNKWTTDLFQSEFNNKNSILNNKDIHTASIIGGNNLCFFDTLIEGPKSDGVVSFASSSLKVSAFDIVCDTETNNMTNKQCAFNHQWAVVENLDHLSITKQLGKNNLLT